MAKHVLVPLDGSPPSWEALEYAVGDTTADRITVLNVVDPAAGVIAGAEAGYYDAEAFERAKNHGEETCEEAKERYREDERLADVELETVVGTGEPASHIVDFADEQDVDHIVMGSHGRTGVTRILLGSVTETVTRRSPVPVTIVR